MNRAILHAFALAMIDATKEALTAEKREKLRRKIAAIEAEIHELDETQKIHTALAVKLQEILRAAAVEAERQIFRPWPPAPPAPPAPKPPPDAN